MKNLEEKVLSWSTAFAIIAGGSLMAVTTILVVKCTPGIVANQIANCTNKLADAHRLASLAKTYDAKAAALSITTLLKETSNALK